MIGGYLTDHLGWRWVFLVSVPFAIRGDRDANLLRDRAFGRSDRRADRLGGRGLAHTGNVHPLVGRSGRFAARVCRSTCRLLGVSVALLVLFVIREHHAADPILPMDLMTRPTIAASLIGSFLVGGILFGLETYVPLYMQGVRGGDATLAGRALMPLFLAWAISVALAARAVVHYGFRRGGMVGSALVALGTLGLVMGTTFPDWSRVWFFVGLAVCGLGIWADFAQLHPGRSARGELGPAGVATGAVTFLRTIGGAIGVGLLGATLGWELAHRLAVSGAIGNQCRSRSRPETHELLTATQLAAVQANLGLTLATSISR